MAEKIIRIACKDSHETQKIDNPDFNNNKITEEKPSMEELDKALSALAAIEAAHGYLGE